MTIILCFYVAPFHLDHSPVAYYYYYARITKEITMKIILCFYVAPFHLDHSPVAYYYYYARTTKEITMKIILCFYIAPFHLDHSPVAYYYYYARITKWSQSFRFTCKGNWLMYQHFPTTTLRLNRRIWVLPVMTQKSVVWWYFWFNQSINQSMRFI